MATNIGSNLKLKVSKMHPMSRYLGFIIMEQGIKFQAVVFEFNYK